MPKSTAPAAREKSNSYEYTHPSLNEDVSSISGHYSFIGEGTVHYKGREVLYLNGFSVTDSACCGTGGCVFSFVPGYILRLRHSQNERREYISEIEPITDELAQRDIAELIKKIEPSTQINFLQP